MISVLQHQTSTTSFGSQSSTSTWKPTVIGAMTPLSTTFTPGPHDVICSRGRKAKQHIGNINFHSLLSQEYANKYANAGSKLSKSLLVSEIIDRVRQSSPDGGFVKQNTKTGQWYEIGDVSAREKVSQWIRDSLSGQYKSSANAKKRRREESTDKMYKDMTALATSDSFVSKRIRHLSDEIEREGSTVSEMYLMLMMTKANLDILRQLNSDNSSSNDESSVGSENQ